MFLHLRLHILHLWLHIGTQAYDEYCSAFLQVKDIPDADKIAVHQGKIEFQDVCFRYEPR